MFGTLHEDYYKEVQGEYKEGNAVQVVLLGMEMSQQGLLALDGKFIRATPAALWLDVTLPGGHRMDKVPLSWNFIRILGKTCAVSSLSR